MFNAVVLMNSLDSEALQTIVSEFVGVFKHAQSTPRTPKKIELLAGFARSMSRNLPTFIRIQGQCDDEDDKAGDDLECAPEDLPPLHPLYRPSLNNVEAPSK